MSKNAQLSNRQYIVGGFFILIAIVYISRLFYIQIIDDQYKMDARNNAFRYRTEYPVRGYIFDRKGKLLVMNAPSYDLVVTPKQVKGCDTVALCEILEIDKAEFLRRIKKACQAPNSPRKESIFEKQLSPAVYAALQEKLYRFKGFDVQSRTIRKYPRSIAAHLLGYVGEVSKEKAANDPYYREGDYIGVSGIERSYEEALRGKKGVQIVMVDVHNKTKGRYMNGLYDTLAVSGKALFSSIDAELQEYGEKLMHGKKGSIVAIEPQTGEILCVVSNPGYDPNLLVGGKLRSKNYALLQADTLNVPLFNRATQAMYPPGSIFKLIDALIGQKDGVLKTSTVYPCHSGYPPMGGKPKCHAHPACDLTHSIQQSCNSYYSYVFRSIVDQPAYPRFKDGYQHWHDAVMSFGPGTRLGYDIPYEKPGNVPSVKYYNKVFGENGWRSNTIVSLGIGQAELTIVPIQMANVMCIIANHGFYYIPHVIKGVGVDKKLDTTFTRKHYAYVTDHQIYENVIDGMQLVVESGTARTSRIKDINMCGKTGTAQNPHGEDHAVFVAFAPRENPKIAIACVVENSGFGGTYAAPIVSLMVEKYLKGAITRPEIEKRMMEVDIIHRKNLIPTRHH